MARRAATATAAAASPAPTRGGGRPRRGYFAVDGVRVPATTTIGNRFKESGGLLFWANQQGLEGKTLDEAREPATSIGDVVHGMVESFLHGEPVEEPKTLEALTGFESFRDWWEAGSFVMEETEVPLVSEAHRFGGTLDGIGRDHKGRRCLFDWKSSNGIYPDYLWQISAYGLLYAENYDEPLTGGYHLARFSKEHGDFEHRHYPHLDDAAELFLGFRKLYDLDKLVAKRAK